MTIGMIGAGAVAQKYAQYFVRQGHGVVLSNSRGPETLADVVRHLGPKARAATVAEAADQDIVILSVRWEDAEQALAAVPDWKGRILVDATNRPLDADDQGKTASEVIAGFAPGAHVVKALNNLVVSWIPDPAQNRTKLVLFVSGDQAAAKAKFISALGGTGFVPVDLGGLVEGGKLQQFGGPLNALHLDLLKRLEC